MKAREMRTWVEIDRKALATNYRYIQSAVKKPARLMAVVKSNAYGHGLVETALIQIKNGYDWLGVDSLDEARALRKAKIRAPILVLNYTPIKDHKIAARQSIRISVSDFSTLRAAIRNKSRYGLNYHLKIDTRFYRRGFLIDDLPRVMRLVSRARAAPEGMFTHFAAADDPSRTRDTSRQFAEFKKWMHAADSVRLKLIFHAANSGAALLSPKSHLDMARVGIASYGLWPSEKVKMRRTKKMPLRPALSWKSVIAEVKTMPEGAQIGYGFTEKVSRDSRIAIVPVGYWHGYPRALSKRAHVLVCSHRSKVLGRISMDMMAIDITGIRKAKPGSVVTLIGRDGREEVTADELARLSGTINYEIVTRINPEIPRRYR